MRKHGGQRLAEIAARLREASGLEPGAVVTVYSRGHERHLQVGTILRRYPAEGNEFPAYWEVRFRPGRETEATAVLADALLIPVRRPSAA